MKLIEIDARLSPAEAHDIINAAARRLTQRKRDAHDWVDIFDQEHEPIYLHACIHVPGYQVYVLSFAGAGDYVLCRGRAREWLIAHGYLRETIKTERLYEAKGGNGT